MSPSKDQGHHGTMFSGPLEYSSVVFIDYFQVPDPKSMQINLQGFLDKNSQVFVLELWNLLLDAQTSLGGIPRVFIEEKKAELLSSRVIFDSYLIL